MTLRELIQDGGRRYAVVITVIRYGFLLALIGLAVAAVVPEIAVHVAGICGSFGLLGSASIVSYQGANAAKDWKHPTGVEVAPGTNGHVPRQSGMVQEPGGAL